GVLLRASGPVRGPRRRSLARLRATRSRSRLRGDALQRDPQRRGHGQRAGVPHAARRGSLRKRDRLDPRRDPARDRSLPGPEPRPRDRELRPIAPARSRARRRARLSLDPPFVDRSAGVLAASGYTRAMSMDGMLRHVSERALDALIEDPSLAPEL